MSKKGYGKKKYKKPNEITEEVVVEYDGYGGTALDVETDDSRSDIETDNQDAKNPVTSVRKWFTNLTSHKPEEKDSFDTEESITSSLNLDNVSADYTSPQKEIKYDENESVYYENKYMKVEEVKPVENRKTVIAEGVEINGNISLDGDLELFGKIKGNVNSTGDIIFAEDAKMEGSLIGNSFTMQDGNIDGNVQLQNNVVIGNRSQIIGDVYALSVVSSGKILGNLFIEDRVILNETSIVEGNIKAKQLEVRPGAIIKGQIEVN